MNISERNKKIIDMYSQGYTLTHIGSTFDLSKTTVHRITSHLRPDKRYKVKSKRMKSKRKTTNTKKKEQVTTYCVLWGLFKFSKTDVSF